MSDLAPRAREILDFEREWWKYAGEKPQAIKSEFNMTEEEYYRQLSFIITNDEAYEYDPMLIKRLRRLAAQRARRKRVD